MAHNAPQSVIQLQALLQIGGEPESECEEHETSEDVGGSWREASCLVINALNSAVPGCLC